MSESSKTYRDRLICFNAPFYHKVVSQLLLTLVGPISDDRPGLPRASLTVGEKGSIETIPGVGQDPFTHIAEDFFLKRKKVQLHSS